MSDIEKLFNELEKCFLKNFNTLMKTNNLNHLFNINSFSPKVKLNEKNNRVYVNVEAPGLSKDHQIKFDLYNNNLIIQGTLSRENEVKTDKGGIIKETYNEYFYKTIPLPVRVTKHGAKVFYENDSLKISLNKIGELEDYTTRY